MCFRLDSLTCSEAGAAAAAAAESAAHAHSPPISMATLTPNVPFFGVKKKMRFPGDESLIPSLGAGAITYNCETREPASQRPDI